MKQIFSNLNRKRETRQNLDAVRAAGFWFVDVPRTSSTSIKAELGAHFGPAYGKANVIEGEHASAQLFRDHIPARVMRDMLGATSWDQIYTFGMVRNPWDRILSLYHYVRKRGRIPQDWDFPTYVRRLVDADSTTPHFSFHGFRRSAADYLTDESGTLLVDDVLRFEDRAAGLARVGARIGLPELGQLHLQSAGKAQGSYRDAYDEETRDLIAQRYASDIAMFGYQF